MRSKHRRQNNVPIFIAIGIILLLILGGYCYKSFDYSDRFLPNTTANGVDIGKKTIAQANTLLQQSFTDDNLIIKDNNKTWIEVSKKDLGYSASYTGTLKQAKNQQNNWTWLTASISSPKKISLNDLSLDKEKNKKYINQLQEQINQLNQGRTETKNATIVKGDSGFEITPEVQGNSINVDKAMKGIKNAIDQNKNSIELEKYVVKPTITSTSSTIKKELDKMNKLADQTLIYTLNGEEETVPKEILLSSLEFNGNDITVNAQNYQAYLQTLGVKYNTSINPTKFKSTKRGEVTVPAGTYGWSIQEDKETEAATKDILAGNGFKRAPIVAGATQADHKLIQDTYVEVDLQAQHMWYYKDGKVFLETDIVSGKPSTPTPAGVFYIWNKESPSILVGENYRTPVDYWMPIDWNGVGIHDSPWQPAYGGALYKTVGSHGCVNTPPSVVAKLYNNVEVGTPVLVF